MTAGEIPPEVRHGIIERLVALHNQHGKLSCASLMKLGLIRLNGGEAVLTDKAAQSLGVAAKDGAS